MMRITRATPDDLDALVAFRDEAARWLASKGIDQWQEPWPTEDLMVEGMLRNIEAGETFIVWDDDHTPAATITVNRWAKPELGAELLDWAGPRRPTKGPTGYASTCGRPTSASSTTTCVRASPTSARSSCPTTPPERCSSGQPGAFQPRTCKRSSA